MLFGSPYWLRLGFCVSSQAFLDDIQGVGEELVGHDL
jgi:hypothetical protein